MTVIGCLAPMTVIWARTPYDAYMGLPLYDGLSLTRHTRYKMKLPNQENCTFYTAQPKNLG